MTLVKAKKLTKKSKLIVLRECLLELIDHPKHIVNCGPDCVCADVRLVLEGRKWKTSGSIFKKAAPRSAADSTR